MAADVGVEIGAEVGVTEAASTNDESAAGVGVEESETGVTAAGTASAAGERVVVGVTSTDEDESTTVEGLADATDCFNRR